MRNRALIRTEDLLVEDSEKATHVWIVSAGLHLPPGPGGPALWVDYPADQRTGVTHKAIGLVTPGVERPPHPGEVLADLLEPLHLSP